MAIAKLVFDEASIYWEGEMTGSPTAFRLDLRIGVAYYAGFFYQEVEKLLRLARRR